MAAKKPPAPTMVGDWQLIHGVGNGAFGAAIKARNIHTGKLAVLKFLNPQQKATDPKEIESEARRFKNEMKLLSAFDSPYISKLFDADMAANPPWIALQYFAGTTVLEEINENGPIDEAKWFELAHDILSALSYIHAKGVIHRDLNPKNVMLVYGGARLIDFGISRIEGASKSSTHYYGFNGYTSPEHYVADASPKNDVFVTATILAFAGTGHLPWKADTNNRYEGSITNDNPNYKGLSDKQQTLLRAMHKKSPNDRASVDQALKFLSSLTSSQPEVKAAPARVVKTARVAPEPKPVRAPITIGTPGNSSMGIGAFLEKNKLVIALAFFTGGWGLIPYWIWRQLKKKDSVPGPQVGIYLASIGFSVVSIGYLTFIPLFYWARRYRNKNILGMAIAAVVMNFATNRILALKNSAGALPSWAGLYILSVYIAIFLVHRYMYTYVKTGEAPVKRAKKVKKVKEEKSAVVQPSAPVAEPVAEVSDPNVTTGDNSWTVVESTIFEYLARRKGKQFTIEILSNTYTGIYFQGYSEPGGYITVEAASNISVQPPLEAENRKGLIKIGWEPPSDGLPNFIKFLDLKESENAEIAKLFVETLQDGYKLKIGTFKVEV